MQLNVLEEILEKKFIKSKEVAFVLATGFLTKKNIFLYGRGGHAKSEMVSEFLKFVDPKGKESFVQMCGEGLSEEKLFGGVDLKVLKETGSIQYLVENSFMNKKYVVFEELLDSRLNVLLSLKDILTSGYFRNGDQVFKIKTEMVICLTNRTKQEVSEDDSIKALLERFPLEQKVEWDSYSASDYQAMFKKLFGEDHTEVAKICAEVNAQGGFISPRTAVHMAQTTKVMGNDALALFNVPEATIKEIDKRKKTESQKQEIGRLHIALKQLAEKILPLNSQKDAKGLKDLLKQINSLNNFSEIFPENSEDAKKYLILKNQKINLIKACIYDVI
jgi:MoxR domain in the MoxR-vWA-beta-propeller ternary systems